MLEIGSMRFRFQGVPHFTETFAIDIASTNGGGRITYGADCSPNEQLVEFARDTDLLIVEATLPRPERTGIRGHLTPAEAGEHASRANVKAGAADTCVRRARRAVGAPVRLPRFLRAGVRGPRGSRIRDGRDTPAEAADTAPAQAPAPAPDLAQPAPVPVGGTS